MNLTCDPVLNMKTFYTKKITYAEIWTSWCNWHFAPCTLAVVAGPMITTIYRLTRPADAGEGSFSLAQVARGILCIAMFISLYFSGRLHLLGNPIIRPLMFLAIYAVMTCMIGPYLFENIIFTMKLIFTVLVFTCAFHLAQSKSYSENWLIGSAWIVLVFMIISQVIGLVTGNTVAYYKSEYATAGVIGAVSVTAALIVSTLPVFLRFFPDSRAALTGVIVLLISLFFTMRRTELLAAIAAILWVLFSKINPFRLQIPFRKVLLVALVLCVLTVIGWRSQAGQDLLNRMDDLNPTKGSGSGRYIFWRISLNHILNRSIDAQMLGEGMGSIRDVMYKHFGLAIGSHTELLDMLYAFGIFGLFTVVWWYLGLIRFVNYLRVSKDPTLQAVSSTIVILFIVSIGQGSLSDASFALTYAALGFWAGQVHYGG